MLPADTLKEIERLTLAGRPDVVKVAGQADHLFFLRQADGELKPMISPPAPPDFEAFSLDGVVAKAKEWLGDTGTLDVWFCRTRVCCPWGHDLIRFDLQFSPQMAKLMLWEQQGKVQFRQAEMIYLLRTLFDGAYHPESLLENVRRLDMKQGQHVQSEQQKGKISVSKTMLAEMAGVDKIPDYVRFFIPVFANASLRHVGADVKVVIEPDPQAESFWLSPVPGESEKAVGEAEAAVGKLLAQLIGDQPDGGPRLNLYYGKP